MKNIFIVGPVASGKNTLMENILKNNDFIALDTGRIYRYVAKKIYDYIKNEINISKIIENDADEKDKLLQKVYHLTKFYTNQLSSLKFNGKNLYDNNGPINFNELYSKETNAVLPIIAKIPTLREKINQFINNNISNFQKPIVMTGHNIKEIDTTKFTIVFLDVDKKVSAHRLYNRNKDSYNEILDAFEEVIKRNEIDKINFTKMILPYLYDFIYIDSTNKSKEQIYNEFCAKTAEIKEKNDNFLRLQKNSLDRDKFEWLFNVILQPIKLKLEKITNSIVNKYPFINKNDLIYQTLIHLTSHNLEEIYDCDSTYLTEIEYSITHRDSFMYEKFYNDVADGKVQINMNLVLNDLLFETLKLVELYSDKTIQKIMINYNSGAKNSNIKFENGYMIKNENEMNNSDKIIYKPLSIEMSSFISKYCHYLHTPRNDELISYGAFLDDDEYPIAYVSFSKQDRDYKKQLLFNLGIEPQNSIEMTRAWCSNSAPINIMSSLFQYAINDISNQWKNKCKDGLEDKYLQAITTAINPNLGFKASSFLGCNFFPIALRPAKFTFKETNGLIEYVTRRESEKENSNQVYFENKFEILPLNELILCLNKTKEVEIKKSRILLINKNNYDKVLENKNLIKK